MDEDNGVFLLSKNLGTGFLIKCMQVLQKIFPEVELTSIASDELHFGYKVHFSSPQKDIVVMRKHLTIYGEEVPIGFLRTTLTIHDVRKNGGKQLENEIRETICNQFGKHLYFDHALSTENETTRKLRACVDVPELEELEIFNHEGNSDMFICLPSNNEMLKVTFYCRWCNKDEHARRSCPNIKMKNGVIEKSNVPCTSDAANCLKLESPNGYDDKTRKEEARKEETLPERDLNNREVKQGSPSISMTVNEEVNIIPKNFPRLNIKIQVEQQENHTDNKSSESPHNINRQVNNISKNETQDLKFNIDDEVLEIDSSEGSSNHSNGHYSFTFKSEDKDDEMNPREDFQSKSKKLPCFEKPSISSRGSTIPSTVSSVPSPLKPAADKKENEDEMNPREDFKSNSKKLPCFEKPSISSHGSTIPSTLSLVPSPLKPAADKKENDVRKSTNEDFNLTSAVEEFFVSHAAGPSSKNSAIPMNAATAVEDRKISIPAIQASDDNNHDDANSNDGLGYFQDLLSSSSQLLSSSSQSTAGPSSRNPATPSKLTREQQLKLLSPHLQTCINDACAEFNILTREELNAFLIHVKNKSKPSELSRHYTRNPQKLKRMLEEIINSHFKTPRDVTKDDTYFINWLKRIVKRFDDDDSNDPKKRRLSDQCHNDSPNKK